MHSDNRPCGRPIYVPKSGVSSLRVCVMHSDDSSKPAEEFQQEIESILAGTSEHNRVPGVCDFTGFVFPVCDLSARTFQLKMQFHEAKFNCDARFDQAVFGEDADFSLCEFRKKAVFSYSRFVRQVRFFSALFRDEAFFAFCRCNSESEFGYASFSSSALFQGSRFSAPAGFVSSIFSGKVNFSGMVVGPAVEEGLAPTSTEHGTYARPVMDFRNASFLKPHEVIFYQVNTASLQGFRVRFVHCSRLDEIEFEDVNWNRRGRRRIVLQDELDVAESEAQSGTNHELVANAYRKLMKNFDNARHYDLSEDCFCGAMEMKRLSPDNLFAGRFRPIDRLYRKNRWLRYLGRLFSVVSFYRILSNYGSSYVRAWVIFGLLFLAFVVSYPALGLRMVESVDISPQRQAQQLSGLRSEQSNQIFFWSSAKAGSDFLRILGAGFWMALDQATFRKSPSVEPVTKWGKRLALVEMVVIPGQLALVLLALRRRLRR